MSIATQQEEDQNDPPLTLMNLDLDPSLNLQTSYSGNLRLGSPRRAVVIPISRSSEYAIRALAYLGQKEGNEFSLARDMAVALDIPAPFLGKVLQPLVARRMLHSQRGRHGGFRLAVPPAEITLFQIVDSQEHLGRARQCLLGQAECSDERACPMHDFWKGASTDFLGRLANTTLSDLLRFCRERPASGYPLPRESVRPPPGHNGSPKRQG